MCAGHGRPERTHSLHYVKLREPDADERPKAPGYRICPRSHRTAATIFGNPNHISSNVCFYSWRSRPTLDTKTLAGITGSIVDVLHTFIPWDGLYIFCNSFPPLPDFFYSFSIVHIFTPVHPKERIGAAL